MIFMTLYRICLTGLRTHFYTPLGVPCEHPLPLPLGEVAECSECLKGRNTRENILPLPLGEVAERSEDGEGNQLPYPKTMLN